MCASHHARGFLALAFVCLISACESDSNSPDQPGSGTLQVNATSATAFSFYSFSGDSLVPAAGPANSSNWDIGFRRFTIQLNSGVAGPKDVRGFNLANNVGADTAAVLGFTPENQLAAFTAVSAGDIPNDTAFKAEDLGPDLSTWFRFDPVVGGLVANPQASWKLRRSASADYAVFRVSRMVASTTALDSVVIQYRLQPSGGTLGAIDSVKVGAGGAAPGANLGTGTAVAATGCGWDVKVTVAFELQVNGTCGAGTFPVDISEDFTALTHADDAPEYGLFLALISGPVPASFSDPNAPLLYNLAGDNRLSPTFNIYLVKIGTSVYKLQVIDYYNGAGQSGYPTIRYSKIQ
jgi:hypothetical protein